MIVSPVFVALSTRFTIYIYIPHFPEFVAIFFHDFPWANPEMEPGTMGPTTTRCWCFNPFAVRSSLATSWTPSIMHRQWLGSWENHGKFHRDVMGIEWISNSTNHPVYNGYQPRFDQPKQWEVVAAVILIWYMDLIPNTLVYSKISNGPTVLDCVQQSAKHSLSQVQPCSAKLLLSWMHF